MSPFFFDLEQRVIISASGEVGTVIGRAEYLNQNPQYWLRYKCADGRAVECWWEQSALEPCFSEK